MTNSCILTGGSGFIGQNLIAYLKERNNVVHALKRHELHSLTPTHLSASATVVHLAGIAHDLKKGFTAEEYYQINFGLTKVLFDAFLVSDAKKFIFISSVKAVADEVSAILTEEQEPSPETVYGQSKLKAEQYITSHFLPTGKSVYILRPCMTHGKGNKGNLNLLFKVVNSGFPYPLAAFENKRSFLSIQNLCFVIKEIIDRDDIPSDTYNIADDRPLSTNEVVSILAMSLNKVPWLVKIPPAMVHLLGKIGDHLHLPLNTDRLNKLTQNYVVSNAKIKSVLEKALPLSSIDGLKLTASSFVTNIYKEEFLPDIRKTSDPVAP